MWDIINSLVCLIGSMYVTIYMQKRCAQFHNSETPPLYDIGHRPEWLFLSQYYYITDYMLNFYILLHVFVYNECFAIYNYLLSIIFIIRALSFGGTILPKCGFMPDKDPTDSASMILWRYLTLQDTHIGFNNDLLFSGHAATMLLFSLCVTYFREASISMTLFLWICTITSSIFIWISRCHYWVNILFAYITTLLVFVLYAVYDTLGTQIVQHMGERMLEL